MRRPQNGTKMTPKGQKEWIYTQYMGGLNDYINRIIQVLDCELKSESLSISRDMSTGVNTKYTKG